MLYRYPNEFQEGKGRELLLQGHWFCQPKLLILDEPTSALDVLVQDSVLKLLLELQSKYNLSYCFISHDLNLIKKMCHRTYVMKDSVIIEHGTTREIFKNPQEAYTRNLLESSFINY